MLDIFEEWQKLNQLFENEQKQMLNEAPLSDGQHLSEHVYNHVLQPGEAYNPREPKFVHTMGEQDYLNAAIELAKEPIFGTYNMKWLPVVGWETKPDGAKRTFIKLRWRAKREHLPDEAIGTLFPAELVVFTDLENPDITSINSYYLITQNNVKTKLERRIGDIPENNETN